MGDRPLASECWRSSSKLDPQNPRRRIIYKIQNTYRIKQHYSKIPEVMKCINLEKIHVIVHFGLICSARRVRVGMCVSPHGWCSTHSSRTRSAEEWGQDITS